MEPGFVRIIHPELGADSISEVPETSLSQWYMSGWRLLKDNEAPPVLPLSVPEPVSLAEVTTTAAVSHETAPKKEK